MYSPFPMRRPRYLLSWTVYACLDSAGGTLIQSRLCSTRRKSREVRYHICCAGLDTTGLCGVALTRALFYKAQASALLNLESGVAGKNGERLLGLECVGREHAVWAALEFLGSLLTDCFLCYWLWLHFPQRGVSTIVKWSTLNTFSYSCTSSVQQLRT